MALRDFNALVDQMIEDVEAEKRDTKSAGRGRGRGTSPNGGERRTPVMT
jgi:outer membrane murein-binding lipoprotein Lpp